MTGLLLLAGLAAGAEPPALTLPARVRSLPADPYHLRVDGDQVYVSGFHAQKLVALTAGRKRSARELPLDAYEDYRTGPEGREVREVRRAAGGDLVLAAGKVFVAQVFQESVLVVDRDAFTPVRRLPLGGDGCLAASPDGRTVYYARNAEPEFHVIDSKSYKHRAVAYPDGCRGIGCLAVSPDGKRLYLGIQRGGEAAGGNGVLAAYDLEKGAYAGTAVLGRRAEGTPDPGMPWSLAFAPDGKRIYVGTFQSASGVLVVDPQKMEQVDNIYFGSKRQTPPFPWVDPMGVAVFDRWLLVAVRHNQEMVAVELGSHRVVAHFAQDPAVTYQRVVVAGDRVFLAGESSRLVMVKAKDLSRLLSAVDVGKTGPVKVTLGKR
jgi:hypothetical protein